MIHRGPAWMAASQPHPQPLAGAASMQLMAAAPAVWTCDVVRVVLPEALCCYAGVECEAMRVRQAGSVCVHCSFISISSLPTLFVCCAQLPRPRAVAEKPNRLLAAALDNIDVPHRE